MSITFSHKSALELYCSPFILELLPYYRKTDNQLERKNYTPRRVALSRCSAPTKTEIRALASPTFPSQALSPQTSRSSLSPQDPTDLIPSSIRYSLPFHFSLPIHCLVDDSNKRRADQKPYLSRKIQFAWCLPLPKLAEKMKDSFAATLNSMQSKNLDFFSSIARSDTALNLKFSASSTPSAKTQNQNFTNRTYCLIPPEYLFLQMAETMNFLDLLLLGFELCGTYFSGQGIDAFREHFDRFTKA